MKILPTSVLLLWPLALLACRSTPDGGAARQLAEPSGLERVSLLAKGLE